MSKNSGNILVLVEHRDNDVDTTTLQLLHKGRQLADQLQVDLGAIVIGSDISTIANNVAGKGVDTVFVADHPKLSPYNPEIFTTVLADMIQNTNTVLLLMGYSFLGMEIGPAIATRLRIPLASNCINIDLSSEKLPIMSRPVYSGMAHVKIEGAFPLIVSIQKGALPTATIPPQQAKMITTSIKIEQNSIRTEVKEILRPNVGEADLTKSNVIVAVGRGIGQGASIELARKLAKALGGVVAATRPVIDMGWLPPEYQVGLSGKTVSPRVYIACGISGAAQHVAGMIDSQMIIAINKDQNAPIFNVAHYAIVGDLFEVLPSLIDAANGKV